MAFADTTWYVDYGNGSSTGYYAVAVWPSLTAVAAGALHRQSAAPAVGSERVFVCIVAGTTLVGEPSWTTTRGAKTAEAAGPTWQECTGASAVNGDLTNTPNWTTVKNTAVSLGQIIQRNNAASYQICSTAGTAGNGSEPSFSDTAGTTTADNTVTWTSLGAVGNFTGWQAPHARLANAFASTWGAAGHQFFVGNTHAETQASAMTLTSPGTPSTPCFVYCVTKTTVPPVSANLSTAGTITTTGSFNITMAGSVYIYGITFSTGTTGARILSVSNANSDAMTFDACNLRVGSSTNSTIQLATGASTGTKIILNNTKFQFATTGSSIVLGGRPNIIWRNTATAITGATIPTTLFTSAASAGGVISIEGVDLSALGSGTIIGTSTSSVFVFLKDCKLGSSAVISVTPTGAGGSDVTAIRCDSGATNYRTEKYQYMGTQTVETTIVRTGGASDGTTTIAWKIVTTANSKWILPFEVIPMTIWNDTTGSSKTVTIYGIWGGGAVPNNDEIWIDVEYLGSSATPQGSFATSTKADNLAAGSATTSDGSTWGGSTTAFKMSATFTPQMKGPITVYVKAAKVSSTFYIDPKIEVT